MVKFVPRTLLFLAVFFHSVFSIQPKHFSLGIREGGSDFNEDIDIDEEKGEVLLRVPTHNNIDGASFLNDFNLGLTITRIPVRQACHVSKMDPEFPKPVNLNEDLTRAASQRDEMPVITKKSLLEVTGPANRSLLTKEILDFCGTFPIYNIETTEAHFRVKSNGDETQGTVIRHRVARQSQIVRKYMACTPDDPLKYIEKCMSMDTIYELECKMKGGTCYYFVRCVDQRPSKTEWKCTRVHNTNYQPVCCDLVCP